MNIEFIVKSYIAFSERDNFEKGCDPASTQSQIVDAGSWSADSLQGLVNILADEFGADRVDLAGAAESALPYVGEFILDSCEEPGRLDIQIMQTRPFQTGKPSQRTVDEWKAGKRDMWLTCYSFVIEQRVTGFALSTLAKSSISTRETEI